jgi:hypothetical protein
MDIFCCVYFSFGLGSSFSNDQREIYEVWKLYLHTKFGQLNVKQPSVDFWTNLQTKSKSSAIRVLNYDFDLFKAVVKSELETETVNSEFICTNLVNIILFDNNKTFVQTKSNLLKMAYINFIKPYLSKTQLSLLINELIMICYYKTQVNRLGDFRPNFIDAILPHDFSPYFADCKLDVRKLCCDIFLNSEITTDTQDKYLQILDIYEIQTYLKHDSSFVRMYLEHAIKNNLDIVFNKLLPFFKEKNLTINNKINAFHYANFYNNLNQIETLKEYCKEPGYDFDSYQSTKFLTGLVPTQIGGACNITFNTNVSPNAILIYVNYNSADNLILLGSDNETVYFMYSAITSGIKTMSATMQTYTFPPTIQNIELVKLEHESNPKIFNSGFETNKKINGIEKVTSTLFHHYLDDEIKIYNFSNQKLRKLYLEDADKSYNFVSTSAIITDCSPWGEGYTDISLFGGFFGQKIRTIPNITEELLNNYGFTQISGFNNGIQNYSIWNHPKLQANNWYLYQHEQLDFGINLNELDELGINNEMQSGIVYKGNELRIPLSVKLNSYKFNDVDSTLVEYDCTILWENHKIHYISEKLKQKTSITLKYNNAIECCLN